MSIVEHKVVKGQPDCEGPECYAKETRLPGVRNSYKRSVRGKVNIPNYLGQEYCTSKRLKVRR